MTAREGRPDDVSALNRSGPRGAGLRNRMILTLALAALGTLGAYLPRDHPDAWPGRLIIRTANKEDSGAAEGSGLPSAVTLP